MATHSLKIGVIGAGVVGLSTAVSIVENVPGVDVTVIAEHFSPDTTSDGAAGLWMPYLLGVDTSADTQMYWTRETFEFLKKLYSTENSSEIGISLITGYCLVKHNQDGPLWKDIVFGYRQMKNQELQMFGVEHGFAFTTFTTECTKFLPYLTKRFQSFGGKLQQRKVENFQELAKDYAIVVNCTGTWAKHLANDQGVYPIRGQIMRVSAPWIKMFIINEEYYIIPLTDSVVLGGTHQEDNWNLTATDADRENILTNCYKFIPSLKHARVIKEWVGLRPGRKSVRLERQQLQIGTKALQVIHNYGHGGSGVTVFWGCAMNAVQLIKEALNDVANQANATVPKSRI